MSNQLLEVALDNVAEMTRALENVRDKDAALPHITKLNAIHAALLEAKKLYADNEILEARIKASGHIAQACPTVISSSHAIGMDVIRAFRDSPKGLSELGSMLDQIAKVTVTGCVSSLMSQAGKNGGFALEEVNFQQCLKVHYRVGVHDPCSGLTDLDGLLKQFAAKIQKLPR